MAALQKMHLVYAAEIQKRQEELLNLVSDEEAALNRINGRAR